ncbi:MerR family transcriptional regulator [Intestinimonas massiliensis (ex Afouda et al. 2020)]|uniref:MerR family transcriptional regulator n=1 Tax=Intestinimonas massiliensis (ex Afouda et al. 2020) TaxID=1673721 RepID=UPI00102FEE49|nr:MerR family transcriptional regulator [Intestinimonas massiliensis (ex Afouda et al. 2020)]
MKMKEVCTATGLTERAVRFYVQEQLVIPQSQRRGGRTWLDFSPADVDRLRAIAVLRKAGFTLEEIRSMVQDFQKNAPGAAFALRQRLREAIESYERLSRTDTAQADGLEDYAALLEQEVRDAPLPKADQRPISRLNWASIIETVSMILFVCVAWRLYVYLIDCGSNVSALFSIAAWNPLMVILPFVVLILPIGLVLGSKAGKWLYRHFEYVP